MGIVIFSVAAAPLRGLSALALLEASERSSLESLASLERTIAVCEAPAFFLPALDTASWMVNAWPGAGEPSSLSLETLRSGPFLAAWAGPAKSANAASGASHDIEIEIRLTEVLGRSPPKDDPLRPEAPGQVRLAVLCGAGAIPRRARAAGGAT